MDARETRFVQEYIKHLDPLKAALAAGYSRTMAGTKAFVWVSDSQKNPKPYIREAVKKAMDARAKRTEITADRVLAEYARIAFYNAGRVMRSDINGLPVIDMSNATEDDWRVVSEISNETVRLKGDDDGTITKAKVKLHDKLTALTQIGRHLGMFQDNVKHSYDLSNLSDEELDSLERITNKVANPGRDRSGTG